MSMKRHKKYLTVSPSMAPGQFVFSMDLAIVTDYNESILEEERTS
jgi:hypothetical protein